MQANLPPNNPINNAPRNAPRNAPGYPPGNTEPKIKSIPVISAILFIVKSRVFLLKFFMSIFKESIL